MTTLFHVAPKRLLKEIKQKGLRPRKSPGAIMEDPAIFLGATPKEAVNWASYNTTTGKFGFKEPMVILAVKDPGYFYEDPEAFDLGGSYITEEKIPPENIRVVGYLEPGVTSYTRTKYAKGKIASLKPFYTDYR